VRFLSRGPEETSAFGAKLGGLLKKGDTVCLYGELGSGKTTFVKGIASALGIAERDVASASFTIIAEYVATQQDGPVPFYHIDLYRIENPRDLDSIGVEEYVGRDGISAVEWAERFETAVDAIAVTFTMLLGEKREIVIEGVHEEDWNNM